MSSPTASVSWIYPYTFQSLFHRCRVYGVNRSLQASAVAEPFLRFGHSGLNQGLPQLAPTAARLRSCKEEEV